MTINLSHHRDRLKPSNLLLFYLFIYLFNEGGRCTFEDLISLHIFCKHLDVYIIVTKNNSHYTPRESLSLEAGPWTFPGELSPAEATKATKISSETWVCKLRCRHSLYTVSPVWHIPASFSIS